jgi:polyribonucleotide nucleotidyltransferase
MVYEVRREISGISISIETGKVAKQANGAVIVRSGDSVVLVTACVGVDKEGDFLPLTIDYVEKDYAAGKIPGGFFKREGKLSEKETLTSRLIDRPCRPLFPEGYSHEIQVIATVLSADPERDTDVLAVLGASAALTLSEAPFEGPIAAVRVARIDEKIVINPKTSELSKSDLSFIVAGTKEAIVMVEGGAHEVPEEEVLNALYLAHQELQVLIEIQLELQQKAGKKKAEWNPREVDTDLLSRIKAHVEKPLRDAVQLTEKIARRDKIGGIKKDLESAFLTEEALNEKRDLPAVLNKGFEDTLWSCVREMMFSTRKRIDGRDNKTVRPIAIEVGTLPRTHGSALFTRGETQAIVVATLGTEAEAQKIDNLIKEENKTFMLHYNFPPFSVGEVRPVRGPGRREIGHGALAERAVKAIIPNAKQFPYVVRIVSEITESNGSSSMASVCGASLALMDAGVPIKAPVAGVAMGLIKNGDDYIILTDILGDEDHLGDMDFKVCGTEKGVTALQMDIKIKGLDKAIMKEALDHAREGRLHILAKMNDAITAPRKELSKYAPRIVTIKVNPDKVRDIIGPGGKMIRSITESCDVKIEVTDDGTVNIASNDQNKVKSAIDIINSLTQEAVIGEVYHGIVKRTTEFGAFVEIIPGTDGLVHISQLSDTHVKRVTDIVQEGDMVWVKVLDVDRQGKVRLTMKDVETQN